MLIDKFQIVFYWQHGDEDEGGWITTIEEWQLGQQWEVGNDNVNNSKCQYSPQMETLAELLENRSREKRDKKMENENLQ